jgi:uncharacterized membrane protein
MEYLLIYLLQLAEMIRACAWTSICITVGLAILWITYICTATETIYDEIKKEARESAEKTKKTMIQFLIITIALFLIPARQTLLLCVGTYYGKKAYQQISTNNKIEKINTIIDLELDKIIKGYKYEQ